MAFNTVNKEEGFTLIELMVTLLIMVALAKVTITATNDLAFQARYEQTADMAKKIKAAIIGHPGRYINGQPDISGYVADMGRTPDYLRDLLQAGYCENNVQAYVGPTGSEHAREEASCQAINVLNSWTWADTPCLNHTVTPASSTSIFNKIECEDPSNGYKWLGTEFDPTTELKHGWNGPYLHTSDSAGDNDALNDGWGNEPDAVGKLSGNYGWKVYQAETGDYKFSIESQGKDQADDGDSSDSPDGISDGSEEDNLCYADGAVDGYSQDCVTSITKGEYRSELKPISMKITISYNGLGECAVGYCSDPVHSTQSTCSPTWTAGYCSDPSISIQSSCAAPKIWAVGYCSDSTSSTESACLTANTWTEGYCIDPAYSTKTSCTTSWVASCSDLTSSTKEACEPASTWTPALPNNRQCSHFGGEWTSTISSSPVNICMRVYYRDSGEIKSAESLNELVIKKNGVIQDGTFKFEDATMPPPLIPNGINAIGVYRTIDLCSNTSFNTKVACESAGHDWGACLDFSISPAGATGILHKSGCIAPKKWTSCSVDLYPADHETTQKVIFSPYREVNNIVW